MAVLYALDRRAAVPVAARLLAGHDVVLVERYAASNAAYGAARRHEGADGGFVAWVRALEFDGSAPVPDHHLLLAVPEAVAPSGAAHRERTEPGRGATGSRPTRPAGAHRTRLRRPGRGGLGGAVDGARRARRGRPRGAARPPPG
jgi:hypothetical protein